MLDTTVRKNKRINLNCRVTTTERDELLKYLDATGAENMAQFVRKALNSYIQQLEAELAVSA